jgi:hypothetical protein
MRGESVSLSFSWRFVHRETAMKRVHRWSRVLLWLHLFICVVWLYLFRATHQPPGWMLHVWIWSVLAIQFTWGFTVGLIVGPNRRRRRMLWWSLLTVFMPLYFVSFIFRFILWRMGLIPALIYLAIFVMILACETYGGVLLGAKVHGRNRDG